MDLSNFNIGTFKKNYKKVEGNKEGLLSWIDKNISELEKRGNLTLKDTTKNGVLYERLGWSRQDDNGMIKIRLEVRGKLVFLNEDMARQNKSILCNNDYNEVLSTFKKLKEMVSDQSDDMDLWYVKKGDVLVL